MLSLNMLSGCSNPYFFKKIDLENQQNSVSDEIYWLFLKNMYSAN